MSTADAISCLRAFALHTDDNRADALCTGAAALIEKLEAEIASLNRSMDAAGLEIDTLRGLHRTEFDDARDEIESYRNNRSEWLCDPCKTINPTQFEGRIAQPCPKCGRLMTVTSHNRRKIDALELKVEKLMTRLTTGDSSVKDMP